MSAHAQTGPSSPRVVVAIVTFESASRIRACLESLDGAALAGLGATVMIVDNASSDGTAALIRTLFPAVELLVNDRNLGFAGGANVAIEAALDRGAEFVYLLNPDTLVAPEFLQRALAVAETSESVAAVQSLLLLAPDGDRIDSVGNAIHCFGFGYCLGHLRPRDQAPNAPVEITFASGAAVLLRASALREIGPLDESLFLYCEDLDLGWRLRRAGHSARLAPDSIVVHDHQFGRHAEKYYLLERNRWLVLLKNWSARSLAVLALPLLIDELALLAVAWRDGWLRAKLRAGRELLRRETWTRLRAARRDPRAVRRITDRELAEWMTPRMETAGVESAFLRYVANPAVALVWRLAKLLL